MRFYGVLSVFGTYAHKGSQTWFVLHESLHRTLFYGILSVFGTFAHKLAQIWFVLHETWYTKFFDIYYCVEVVRIENHNHMLQITC